MASLDQDALEPSPGERGAGDLEMRWVRDARAGDRAAFERLIRRHYPTLHGSLVRLVGNPEDAEDLAQETFVRAHRSLEHFRGEAPFGAWLTRIGVHLARDHFRRRGRGLRAQDLEGLPAEPAGRDHGPAALARGDETQAAVSAAVERLPRPLREALVLRVVEGRDTQEVARLTGVRPGTVRTQVMRARRLLRAMLGSLLDGGDEA